MEENSDSYNRRIEEKISCAESCWKKIIQLNAIGCGIITPWNREQPEPPKFYCQIEVNEPFVFGFEDGSTLKYSFLKRIFACFRKISCRLLMDNGYGLKMSNLSSNSGLIELEKEKKSVGKLGSELLATKKDEKGEYGVDYAYEAKISIEEDYIADFMRYYLLKYFDSSLYHVCRNPDYGTAGSKNDWGNQEKLRAFEK